MAWACSRALRVRAPVGALLVCSTDSFGTLLLSNRSANSGAQLAYSPPAGRSASTSSDDQSAKPIKSRTQAARDVLQTHRDRMLERMGKSKDLAQSQLQRMSEQMPGLTRSAKTKISDVSKAMQAGLQRGACKLNQASASESSPLRKLKLSDESVAALRQSFGAATLAATTLLRSNVAATGIGGARATPDQCGAACDELLHSVVKTPFTTYRKAGLYTIELQPPFPNAPPLVLLHGYGSGSGLWAFNLDDLAQHFHVYAVDWLGCGASDRPPFKAATVADGERWFTESLEAWRAAQDIEHAVIVGHSLGGYLSAAYALHHPRRVDHLVLVSPAGIPVAPDPDVLAQRRSHWVYGLLQWGWENNVTPQGIVRALGPFGQKWASDVITRRFRQMIESHGAKHPNFNREAFIKYLYQITTADGSGEFALNVLLSFGAHAREPMGPRLLRAAAEGEVPEASDTTTTTSNTPNSSGSGKFSTAGSGSSTSTSTSSGSGSGSGNGSPPPQPHRFRTPTTFLYGASWDWMPWTAGEETAAVMRELGIDAICARVPQSGHHLYMEQPDLFAQLVLQRLTRASA